MKTAKENRLHRLKTIFVLSISVMMLWGCQNTPTLRIATFQVDATPEIGTPVAYAAVRSITDSLSARGIVILSDQEEPIVLCAVDWIGISNKGLDAWKEQLAEAAGTSADRVSVHTLHQHDGARCDFSIEAIMEEYGVGGTRFDNDFASRTIAAAARALKDAVQNPVEVTDVGFGEAKVEKVASNRRILGEDGKVKIVRFSKSTDPEAQAAPEGVIDPWLKTVSFWNRDSALAVLMFYATHPQSYYGQGDVNPEFVGLARNNRQEALHGVPHIYFTGAAGDVAAGKYNDGSAEMRPVLTKRMEEGMREAWENTTKTPVSGLPISWKTAEVKLPLADHLNKDSLLKKLADPDESKSKFGPAGQLAWVKELENGRKVNVSALKIGDISVLNLPGEPFVEYQLAAQKMVPDQHLCTAAYEEYGAGYIGTEIAYSQGGYETSESATRTTAGAEKVLLEAIQTVLK